MKISLKQAVELIHKADEIFFSGVENIRYNITPLSGKKDNNFMLVTWEEEGVEFEAKFKEGDNQEVGLFQNRLFFAEPSGESFQITLLESWDAEKELREKIK